MRTQQETQRPQRYTDWRGVRTLYSGIRTRQTCGFFVYPPARYSMAGGGVNIQIAPAVCSGSEPPVSLQQGNLTTSETYGSRIMLANPALYPTSRSVEVAL